MRGSKSINRLGIMGGSFNPIHYGHLAAADEALKGFSLDRVIFVPAGIPPHKEALDLAPAEDRYLMTVVATASNKSFDVSRYELDKQTPCYTVETMARFATDLPGTELFFITGLDSVLEISTWHEPDAIFSYGKMIAVMRPGYGLGDMKEIAGYETTGDPESETAKIYVMDVPGVDISATEIRARIREKKPVRYLLPEDVFKYMTERSLFI